MQAEYACLLLPGPRCGSEPKPPGQYLQNQLADALRKPVRAHAQQIFDLSDHFKPIPGLDLGAGIAFNHLIAAKPSAETPAFRLSGSVPEYQNHPNVHAIKVQKVKVPVKASGPTGPQKDSIVNVIRDTTRNYTFKGVKDHPFYCPSIKNRIPVMFGMNLPTFKFIDLLSVQGEYSNSLRTNNIDAVFEQQLPIPYHQDYDPKNGPGFPEILMSGLRPVPSLPAAALLAALFLAAVPANADIPAGYKGTPFGGTPRAIPGGIDFEN